MLHRLFGICKRFCRYPRSAALRRAPWRRYSPVLEHFEDRLVPSQINWTGLGDGRSWSDPNNWDLAVPGTNDFANIGPQFAGVTITGSNVAIRDILSYADLNLTGSCSFTGPEEEDFSGSLTVNGTLTLGAADGFDHFFDVRHAFNFNGTLNLVGTDQLANIILVLYGGGTIAGTENIPAYDGLLFSGGTFMDQGTTSTGDGTVQIDGAQTVYFLNGNKTSLTNASLSGGAAIDGPSDWVQGTDGTPPGKTFTWTGGQLKGTGSIQVGASDSLIIDGGAEKILQRRRLENRGRATWQGTGNVAVDNATIFNRPNGIFLVQNGATMMSTGSTAFWNYGSFFKRASVGTRTTIQVPFHNYGQIYLETGTLYFSGGLDQTDTTYHAAIWLEGNTIQADGTTPIVGGSVYGPGRFQADLSVQGGLITMDPATRGQLVVNMLTLDASSTVFLHIAGNAANQYDSLQVLATARLAGTLLVDTIGGYTIQPTDTFDVVAVIGTLVGDFDVYGLPNMSHRWSGGVLTLYR
jgi:hypothetical protein